MSLDDLKELWAEDYLIAQQAIEKYPNHGFVKTLAEKVERTQKILQEMDRLSFKAVSLN
jgi:hypothetical protein